jgi:hypothetical protein
MRKMLLLVLTLGTVTVASLAPVPKVEAACAWQCGVCGIYCPCRRCTGPLPVCPCG